MFSKYFALWSGASVKCFAIVIALALSVPVQSAEQCSSLTIPRNQERPLGTCYENSSRSCSSDSQCSEHCVKAVCSNDPAKFCTSDSQCGGGYCAEDVTFEFSNSLTCGQFVTGEWWVEAPAGGSVEITSITPSHTPGCESGSQSCRNGWAVDLATGSVPFTGRAFTVSRSPSLPRVVDASNAPVSILKTVEGGLAGCDYPDDKYCTAILRADVLTVVPNGAIPPANAFRPAYAGPDKMLGYYTSDEVDLSKIPSLRLSDLDDRSALPSWSQVVEHFTGPHLGNNRRNSEAHGMLTQNQGTGGYHADRARQTNRHLLRLLLDNDFYTNGQHREALFKAVQSGIDKSWTLRNWARHASPGKRIKNMAVPIMFSAYVLNDPSIADTNYPNMSEQDTFYDSPVYGPGHPADYMWGYNCGENEYFNGSDKWCGDPHGYGEGYSVNGRSFTYQWCCSMGPWKGGALFVHLMQMESVLDVRGFLHVVGRYWDGWASDPSFDQGMWASPDPYNRSGNRHNQRAPAGITPGYQDKFSNAMWDSFRSCAAPRDGDGSTSGSYPCVGMVAEGQGNPSPKPPLILQ